MRTRAEELFDDYLRRRDAHEDVDFDDVCRAHPDCGDELRALFAAYELLSRCLPGPWSQQSLSERLAKEFGKDVDPAIALGNDPMPEAVASSALLEKLRAEGPRGTRYESLGEVARGGMGVVLRVWDAELRRTLAMKVVLAKGETQRDRTPVVDPRTLSRFLEEAQVTGQLDHPGIVPVHELGLSSDGRVYYTMRLVKGVDLRTIFDQVRDGTDGWNEVRALGVLLKVCEAMSYAHDKGVIHRDLKPANVMVGKHGEVYVMDWGVARVLGREDSHDLRIQPDPGSTGSAVETDRREQREETPDSPLMTMDGIAVGTASYMPPEQAMGQLNQLGPHSDVYSVGAMLYQLISGQVPFVPKGARLSPHLVLLAVIDGPPKPLHQLAPRTTPELIAICDKAMCREISGRYPTMQALADDLRAYLEGRVVRAYRTGAWAEARKWVQRNRALSTAMAAAVVFLIFGIVASRRQAARADHNAVMATASQVRATEQELLARRTAEDLLSLSTQRDLDALATKAERLWPASPEKLDALEQCMRDAREFIDGRPADPQRGLKRRPSLAEYRAKLDLIRLKARALTGEQRKADIESHARYAQLTKGRDVVQWYSRMLDVEDWPDQADVEKRLENETLPTDAEQLRRMAWPLVHPELPPYGDEMKAFLLARRAVEVASDADRPACLDTLAWAELKLGRVESALEKEQSALQKAAPGMKEEFRVRLVKLEKAADHWRGDSALSARRTERNALAAEVAALEEAVKERRTWEFDDPETGWWHAQLFKLVSDLDALRDPGTGLLGDNWSPTQGWSVGKRYEFARTIVERSIEGPEAKQRWEQAIDAIASSAKYDGLELRPQLGLLPIEEDRDSGLWEFAHLATGEPAIRNKDGKLALTEETGVVLVLIPGGSFWMGAQRTDLKGQNYDPQAQREESPPQLVTLSPYFLSKYEMTQAQWLRASGQNPSMFGPNTYYEGWNSQLARWSGLHPVEQVSWEDCVEVLHRMQLILPSDARWENGCRAGTTSMWSSGISKETLQGLANLLDQFGKTHGKESYQVWEPWLDDGNTVHATIGSFGANPFGLHDVHGNVSEWVLDTPLSGFYASCQEPDPVAPDPGNPDRIVRGGSYNGTALEARSACQGVTASNTRHMALGLRPARSVETK